MKKYSVNYKYLVSGYIEIEANSAKEAEEEFHQSIDLDAETIEKWYTPIIKLKKEYV